MLFLLLLYKYLLWYLSLLFVSVPVMRRFYVCQRCASVAKGRVHLTRKLARHHHSPSLHSDVALPCRRPFSLCDEGVTLSNYPIFIEYYTCKCSGRARESALQVSPPSFTVCYT
eukprot:GEMP01056830.1.p2 GENE.GEMP01056830.1~~GEMP01056830.1.p2  ORF type:complete len:114 (+),score=1.22 GEMP01056830.1:717-1058(+)